MRATASRRRAVLTTWPGVKYVITLVTDTHCLGIGRELVRLWRTPLNRALAKPAAVVEGQPYCSGMA